MDHPLTTEEELDRTRTLLNYLEENTWFSNIFPERISDPRLNVNLDGVHFDNPVLVGPGWDKLGKLVKIMYQFGFAGVEVGSVLKDPQPGNPKPRFFAKDGATLNRFGFNSPGVEIVAKNLDKYKNDSIPIGISIGKNKEVTDTQAPQAHADVVKILYPYASYFVINVSSPNTP
ncbi:MAG: dihydroorotate dehydrogenase (fumarate), partial [Microgenomates group bacterium Gr01-1014_93]